MLFVLTMSLLSFFAPQSERYAAMNPAVTPYDTVAAARAAANADAVGKQNVRVSTMRGTGSMYPLIKGGEYVLVTGDPFDSLKTGQLAYYSPQWAINGLKAGDAAYLKKDRSRIIVNGPPSGDMISYFTENGGRGTISRKDVYVPIVHRLVQKDKGGWIASGDANPRSESYERITPDNYMGVVTKIYSHPDAMTDAERAKRQSAIVKQTPAVAKQ